MIYIYREIKPSKSGTNLKLKNTFYFSPSAQNRAPILSLQAPIFVEANISKLSQKSGPDLPNRPPILADSETSILSHKTTVCVYNEGTNKYDRLKRVFLIYNLTILA